MTLTRKTPLKRGVECPCGCGVVGSLTRKRCEWCGGGGLLGGYDTDGRWKMLPCAHCEAGFTLGHVRGCTCRQHTGRRNRSKGQKAQAVMHKALGGTGRTPTNEEWGPGYEIKVWPESKSGYKTQTVRLYQFLGTKFFLDALGQAERGKPHGNGSLPAVVIDKRWMIVKLK